MPRILPAPSLCFPYASTTYWRCDDCCNTRCNFDWKRSNLTTFVKEMWHMIFTVLDVCDEEIASIALKYMWHNARMS